MNALNRWVTAHQYSIAYGWQVRELPWVGTFSDLRRVVERFSLTIPNQTADVMWSQLGRDLLDEAAGHEGGPSQQDEESRFLQQLASAADELTELAPKFDREMRFRLQPLQDQWRIRGPGFVNRLKRLLSLVGELSPADESKVPESAWKIPQLFMIGVPPLLGGRATLSAPTSRPTYWSDHLVYFEALLTNVDDRLPEFARLAWLITQAALRECITDDQTSRLAMLITMAIASDLEWFVPTPIEFGLAYELWGPVSKQIQADALGDSLQLWESIWLPDKQLDSLARHLASYIAN